MAYIGKEPQVGNYIKLDAITTSSTNSYDLKKDTVLFTPESALHMLVSLNGVIQSPLSSFSVSGSTITFLPSSGTLSSSDTIDFILVLGNVLDIGTPSDSTVTNAKTNFVSTSSSAGLQIKGDNTTAGTLQLNCEQNSHGIKLRSPAHTHNQSYTLTLPTGNLTAGNVLKINSISGSGTTAIGQLEAPSQLTMPNQPAFHAGLSGSAYQNISEGSDLTVVFDVERFDQGGDYNTSTGIFTAPVTGRYCLLCNLYGRSIDTSATYYQIKLETSNTTYVTIIEPKFSSDVNYLSLRTPPLLADMDASDTAKVTVRQTNGSDQFDITNNTGYTNFSGFLVC
jgi:hypothetical protein